ncbi:hypothetical protein BELL_0733g00020 [Botrytis elliptica]|uniref:Uncharacterized protein n=1 Tax=Botrytis elliptica TaxID=278938 RepID=A0A4Z1JAP3_9HELO|nr:hypothetical protein BELL_0733g00020 [Botrytis elliptica]
MLTSQSHTTNPNSNTGAKNKKSDFDDGIVENDNNNHNNQSMNQNSKRKRSYLPSLPSPSPSPSPSQSPPPKKKKKPENTSNFWGKSSKKFPSEPFTVIPSSPAESDLCTAIIELIIYYARYRPTYDQSFTGIEETTRINKLWGFDKVDDGKIYLKPVQRFKIKEEEIRFVVRRTREILREEEWEAVQRVIAYSHSEGLFIMTLRGVIHDNTKWNLAEVVEESIRNKIDSLSIPNSQLKISALTEFLMECEVNDEDKDKEIMINRSVDVAWRKKGELYPAVVAEIEHTQRDYEGYEVIHQYLTRSPDLVVNYAYALKIGYKAGSNVGHEVIWTLYKRVVNGDKLTSEAGTPVVLRDSKRCASSPDILDTNIFDLSIREILPRRSQWSRQFKKEILDARVHVSGRKILQCIVDAEELAGKKIIEKAASPLVVEGKENGSAFIIEVRRETAEEIAYNEFERQRNLKSDRVSMEREVKVGKKRKREEKAYIAGGVAVMVEDSGSKRRTRSRYE